MAETGRTLGQLLDQVEAATKEPPVSVQTVLHQLGERSFAPIILVIGLLMVSPLSGIPGSPTISALLITLIGAQSLFGRNHLWLPDFLLRRHVPDKKLGKAVSWLRRPADWFDRHSEKRWRLLTMRPARWMSMASCVVVTWIWPFLEILPFVTSVGALAVSFLSFGLLTRDGLYVLLGYVVIAGMIATGITILTA